MKISIKQLKQIIKETINIASSDSGIFDTNSVLSAHKHLEDELGMTPTVSDIADELGLSDDEARRLINAAGLEIRLETDEVISETDELKPEKETNTMECPSCGNPVQSRGRSSDGYGQTYQCPECEHGWET